MVAASKQAALTTTHVKALPMSGLLRTQCPKWPQTTSRISGEGAAADLGLLRAANMTIKHNEYDKGLWHRVEILNHCPSESNNLALHLWHCCADPVSDLPQGAFRFCAFLSPSFVLESTVSTLQSSETWKMVYKVPCQRELWVIEKQSYRKYNYTCLQDLFL